MQRVVWKDGMPLFAEHFYGLEACFYQYVCQWMRSTGAPAEGVFRCEMAEGWQEGNIQLKALEWRLPDGDWVTLDGLLEGGHWNLPPSWGAGDYWLGLEVAPVWCTESVCPKPQGHGGGRPIEYSATRWRWVGGGEDLLAKMEPLFCFQFRAGCWRWSPDWLPTVITPAAHPAWTAFFTELESLLFGLVGGPEVERLQRMWHTLRYESPQVLYRECCAVWTIQEPYHFKRPLAWLHAIKKAMQNTKTPRIQKNSHVQMFTGLGEGMYMASLVGFDLHDSTPLVLSVIDGAQDKPLVIQDLRIGALSRMPRMMRLALPGVSLKEWSKDPNHGGQRFELVPEGVHWNECVAEGVMGLYFARGNGNLKIQLQKEVSDECDACQPIRR